jgi:hypothetical protein
MLGNPNKSRDLNAMNTKLAFRAAIATLAFMTAGAHINAQEAVPVAKAEPVAKAQPVAKAEPIAKGTPEKSTSRTNAARPLSVLVDLLSGTRIEGTLTDKNSLDMQTSFGSAEIPLSEVAGVKFASADDSSTTVVMLNGDSITGATDIKLITVETEWGIAQINGPNITSIMFVPNLAWNPESGLSGKRWKLLNTKAAPAAPGTPGAVDSRGQAAPAQGTTFAPPQFGQPQPVFRSR